ncbi:MAG TPA: Holliday junction branch migration protein RuvA [Gemmatimonadetes bacterium]|nr:Holliday junction branch migration protein RuvA [Gemmatimonadota bacterium]
MISRLKGILVTRQVDQIEIETASGVVYEVYVPLSVLERIPEHLIPECEIYTLQVVRDDSIKLYGFLESKERELFKRLLGASGVGPKMALAMLSTYSSLRLVKALMEKDIGALTQVSGVGKKKAERIVLELADKVEDLADGSDLTSGSLESSSQEAVAALVALGYSFVDADAAVRSILDGEKIRNTDDLIRLALSRR